MHHVNTWRSGLGALTVAGLMTAMTVVPAFGQSATPPLTRDQITGSPVTLDDGSCKKPVAEPEFEIGDLSAEPYNDAIDDLVRDNIIAADPNFADVGNDVALVDEDVNDNGVLDNGEDLNDNGVIDIGLDVNDNGILDDDEIANNINSANLVLAHPTVWTASETVDATFDEIFAAAASGEANESEDDDALENPGIVAVHASSENYGELIACGEVYAPNYDDQDSVVIGLHPMNNSGLYGYAVFEEDDELFGDNKTGVTVYLFQSLPTMRSEQTGEATPTPAP